MIEDDEDDLAICVDCSLADRHHGLVLTTTGTATYLVDDHADLETSVNRSNGCVVWYGVRNIAASTLSSLVFLQCDGVKLIPVSIGGDGEPRTSQASASTQSFELVIIRACWTLAVILLCEVCLVPITELLTGPHSLATSYWDSVNVAPSRRRRDFAFFNLLRLSRCDIGIDPSRDR
jgi:hypothetical protein